MNKKRLIPIIIILVLGISATITSYILINKKIKSAEETKQIIVASRNITPYETINSIDLKQVDVPVDANTEGCYINKEDLIGKITTIGLMQDDWIKDKYIANSNNIKDLVFLTLKTDYTRTGGAKPGSVVDIYNIEVQKQNGEIVTTKRKIAEDVVVINITDKNGISIYSEKEVVVPGTTKNIPIEAIKVAVNSRNTDVSELVNASIEQNNGYVLVVKNEKNSLVGNK